MKRPKKKKPTAQHLSPVQRRFIVFNLQSNLTARALAPPRLRHHRRRTDVPPATIPRQELPRDISNTVLAASTSGYSSTNPEGLVHAATATHCFRPLPADRLHATSPEPSHDATQTCVHVKSTNRWPHRAPTAPCTIAHGTSSMDPATAALRPNEPYHSVLYIARILVTQKAPRIDVEIPELLTRVEAELVGKFDNSGRFRDLLAVHHQWQHGLNFRNLTLPSIPPVSGRNASLGTTRCSRRLPHSRLLDAARLMTSTSLRVPHCITKPTQVLLATAVAPIADEMITVQTEMKLSALCNKHPRLWKFAIKSCRKDLTTRTSNLEGGLLVFGAAAASWPNYSSPNRVTVA